MKRTTILLLSLLLSSLLLTASLSAGAGAQSAQLLDGDARYFDDPPDLIAYANVNHSSPPTGITITDGGGLWRFNEWTALTQSGDWIEATYNGADTTEVGVQLWGDFNDGWGRVLVDGVEVWTGDTYAPTSVGFIRYLRISGLTPGSHTIRVENMGIQGTGSTGDDVAVFFFGFESAVSPPPPSTGGLSFYAIYDRLLGPDSHNVNVLEAAMSGDGKKLILAGVNSVTSERVIYTLNADGSNITSIPLPAGLGGMWEVTINADGSRAFFRDTWDHAIYKVEGGAATEILDFHDYPEFAQCGQIQSTADGEYVFFLNYGGYNGDVWMVNHGGAPPTKVIEDRGVSSTTTYGVDQFAISADGATIAFLLDPMGGSLEELFVRDAGGYRQLTDDRVDKLNLDISGNGTTIAFASGGKRYSVRSDGSARIALEDAALNFEGIDLTYDGSQMFYSDSGANGGRLTQTDGAGRIDLFPYWSLSNITLTVTGYPSISDDGRRVAFISDGALYVGYLNNPYAVPSAPIIHNIAFEPAAMPRDDPNARITLVSQVSDPQGLADIERTSTDEMIDGMLQDYTQCPVYFSRAIHDDGTSPDQTADDGMFSTEGQPGDTISTVDQMTVRVGAQDSSKTVVVADTPLFVGSAGQVPLLPPPELKAQSGAASIELNWEPSTNPELAGYNIYRSIVPDSGFTKINTSPITGDRYLDTSNLSGSARYYYYLTAVDDASNESDPSNICSAVYGQLKLFVPDAYGGSGDTVTLPVNIANASRVEMCAVDIYLTYDPAILSARDVAETALTAGYDWAINITVPGVVGVSIAALQGETMFGDGALFNLIFDVIGTSGDSSQLAFQVTGTSFYDCADLVDPVPLDLSDVGVFTVRSGFMLGDLNGDGVVNSADAALALEIAVRNVIPTPEQETAGDINGDGRINSADGALILRLAAGLPLVPSLGQMQSSAARRATAATISAPTDAIVAKGSSTWVPIGISDTTGVAGADITLNYDPFIVTAIAARTTDLTADFDVDFNVPVAGQIRLSLKPKPGYEEGLSGGSGALVEVQFSANADSAAGMTSTLNLAAARLNDPYGRDFAASALQEDVNTVNGLLTIGEYTVYLPLILR